MWQKRGSFWNVSISEHHYNIEYLISISMKANRGIQKENTRLGIISTIGYFKSQIGDILSDWGIGFFSLTLLYLKSPMCILSPNRDLISPNVDNMSNWGYFLLLVYCNDPQNQEENHD